MEQKTSVWTRAFAVLAIAGVGLMTGLPQAQAQDETFIFAYPVDPLEPQGETGCFDTFDESLFEDFLGSDDHVPLRLQGGIHEPTVAIDVACELDQLDETIHFEVKGEFASFLLVDLNQGPAGCQSTFLPDYVLSDSPLTLNQDHTALIDIGCPVGTCEMEVPTADGLVRREHVLICGGPLTAPVETLPTCDPVGTRLCPRNVSE